MSEAKEFQGKNLDEAIEAACKFFDLKRDKLEIEIISGGSSGIFGLVGVKKAVLRAKPRGSLKLVDAGRPAAPEHAAERRPEEREPERTETPEEPAAVAEEEQQPHGEQPREPRPEPSRRTRRSRGRGRGEHNGNCVESPAPDVDGNRIESPAPDVDGNRIESAAPDMDGNRVDAPQPREGSRRRRPRPEHRHGERPRPERSERPRREPQRQGGEAPAPAPAAPRVPFAELDQDRLVQVARDVTQHLIESLVDNAQIDVKLQNERVLVHIDDPENSGLLIGREGQTLAAIQYLANRMVSRQMGASVRVQIDAGDYRESQDERLRQLARHLADKVVATGRTQSTRPMSSYHRRVVHLALQDDEFVFTRSKGEGALKRVLIMLKRSEDEQPAETGAPVAAPEAASTAASEPVSEAAAPEAAPEAAEAAPAAVPESAPEAPQPAASAAAADAGSEPSAEPAAPAEPVPAAAGAASSTPSEEKTAGGPVGQ